MNQRQAEGIRAAMAMFDRNHNGKLEPEEKEALMKAIGAMIR